MFHTYEELVALSKYINPVKVLETDTQRVLNAAFSPDGQQLAIASLGPNNVYLWNVQNGERSLLASEPDGDVHKPPFQVVFSPDGHRLASAWFDNTIRLWYLEMGSGRVVPQQVLTGHTDQVTSVNFSPDGHFLASGSSDQTVRLQEIETGRDVQILTGHNEKVYCIAFLPGRTALASGSWDKTIRLWEVTTGQTLQILQLRGHVWNLAISPDGRWLAAGGESDCLRLWNMETWEEVELLAGNPGNLESASKGIAWSPDSSVLFSYAHGGAVYIWHVPSGRCIRTFAMAKETPLSYWTRGPLAISPDGRWLATGAPDKLSAIQIWDISVLDVGPKFSTSQKEQPAMITSELQTPVHTHLCTLPFCHIVAQDIPLVRAAGWLQGAAAAGWPLPLALAHDLGLLLSQPTTQLSLQKPAYLPFDEDTSAYLTVLKRLAEHPLVRDLPSWQPSLSDAVLSILLARLVEGLELPDVYRLPSGAEGVRFVRALGTRLADAKPAELWNQTPAGERPVWRTLLSASNLARLEKNLLALKREELRFLALYGAPLTGTPDPRDLLDLLALTGLPPMARLALSQTLNLLPHISDLHTSGGLQTYPEGGYEGLARQGSLDSLLPTETAYPQDVFLHRVLNHEALYYGRERQPEQRRELIYLVGQVGWGLGGDGQVLVRALLLALSQIMQKRDYEVLYSFAGATLSEPHPLDKPGEIGRVLYYQEQAALDSEQVLQGVLQHLRSWRETYQRRLVFWMVSDSFDADEATAHKLLYQALKAESEQQVWYVRVGTIQPEQAKRATPPATARYFERWQVVESALLWTEQKAGSA